MGEAPAPPSFWRAVGLTFETCARHWRTCLALVSLYAVLNGIAAAIGSALSVEIDPARASAGELIAITAAALAGLGTVVIVAIFVYPPTIAALSLIGSAAVFGDLLATHGIVRRTLDRALETIGAAVGAVVVVLGPAVAVIAIVGFVAGLAGGATGAFAAVGLIMLLLLVPGVYVFVRLALALPVVIREGLGPVAALRRSWRLVGGAWWWVFGVGAVVVIAGGVLSSIVSFVVSLGPVGAGNFVLSSMGNAAGAAVMGALVGVMSGVVYATRVHQSPPAALDSEPVVQPGGEDGPPWPTRPGPPRPPPRDPGAAGVWPQE